MKFEKIIKHLMKYDAVARTACKDEYIIRVHKDCDQTDHFGRFVKVEYFSNFNRIAYYEFTPQDFRAEDWVVVKLFKENEN